MRAVLALALLAVPATSTVAAVAKRVPEPETCEILEYGHYHATGPRAVLADDSSVTGERFESDEVEFTDRTRTIARELDKGFGIRYRVRVPANRSTKITWRITYPRAIKGKRRWDYSDRWSSPSGALVQHIGYTFVHGWEMVAGEWKMQILVEDQPACAFTFSVR